MREINLFETSDDTAVVALGFFDCLHLGHRSLLQLAATLGQPVGMLTFCNSPMASVGRQAPLIYDYPTRIKVAESCGVDTVIYAEFNETFRRMPPLDFLNRLFDCVGLKGVVCGRDFTFGNGGEGNVATLDAFCKQKQIPCLVAENYLLDGEKVSSSRIRSLLAAGNMIEANRLLGDLYRIEDVVIHGCARGRLMQMPTANFELPPDRLCPADGVYATQVRIGENVYRAVTNVGAKPTFDEKNKTIETYLIGFNGDLYGTRITVEFIKKLRDIKKFEDMASLRQQLLKDKEWIND